MKALRLTILILLLSYYFVGFGQVPVNWNPQDDELALTEYIYFYEDTSSLLQIDDVSHADFQSKFKHSKNHTFNNSFTDHTFWIKFSLNHQKNYPLILAIDQAVIGDVSFYHQDSTGYWQEKSHPKDMAWYDKSVMHHLNNFEIPKKSTHFLIKIETNTLPIGLKITNKTYFEKNAISNIGNFSLILGFMLFVVLYNLFLYFTNRRIEYLLYCLLISGYLVFTITGSGFIHYFIPIKDIWNWYMWTPILLQPVGMIYALVFLNISKFPKLYQVGKTLVIYFISYILWSQLLSKVGVALTSQINALIGMAMMMYMGYFAGKKGDKLGYYFAFAYVMMLVFGALDVLHINTGFPPNFFGINYMVYGFVFEIIILSYLLTKRIEWENKAIIRSREEAQNKLLQTTLENEKIVKDQNILLEERVHLRTQDLEKSILDLKQAQQQLIQSEKMASLGELTAGIAHEIQNPLNFVNNFSELSVDLAKELNDEITKEVMDKNAIFELSNNLLHNQEKINHHGKRASEIVKGMLQHSRSTSEQKESIDINALCDEYLRLAYHGLRAKNKAFNAKFETDFDTNIPKLQVVPQDIGRVILNLVNNAFYATNERKIKNEDGYEPKIILITKKVGNDVVIQVKDNGKGIPDHLKSKIFQPFFTTKPTGQGTGLGLSLAYDIVNAHNGTMKVKSHEGVGTEFEVTIPIIK